jgi:selenocysteine lyase/cysteine desulfurase
VTVWTSPEANRRAAVVSFQPASLDANKLASALYTQDRIAITTRGGQDRPGLRVSPHFYNSPAEVDRLVTALGKYLKTGV